MNDGILPDRPNMRPDLWFDPKTPGFAARVAQMDLDQVEDALAASGLSWRDDSQLFQFTHPDEVMGLIRDVYGLWSKERGQHVLFDNHPDLDRMRQRVAMVNQQLMHTFEVGVTLNAKGLPEINFSTLRAKLSFEAARDLHDTPDFRDCMWCGGWFTLKRSDRKFCGGRCQTAFWREKQKET
ncbi:hypothetical protein [Shimia sp.]|uniref:hypothetical protein n=1 Tax=Shimia sp. TaxID=1954381 RepID=UPI00329A6118